jgi:hypothetical protein
MEAASTRMLTERVHVYTRSPGEWVVFAAGHFDDRASFHDFEPALAHGRRLADVHRCRLQVHGADDAASRAERR